MSKQALLVVAKANIANTANQHPDSLPTTLPSNPPANPPVNPPNPPRKRPHHFAMARPAIGWRPQPPQTQPAAGARARGHWHFLLSMGLFLKSSSFAFDKQSESATG